MLAAHWNSLMTSCHDCEHFGIGCKGIVTRMAFKDRVDEFCRNLKEVKWRDQLYKTSGTTML